MNKFFLSLIFSGVVAGCASTTSHFSSEEESTNIARSDSDFSNKKIKFLIPVSDAFPKVDFDKSFPWSEIEKISANKLFKCGSSEFLSGYKHVDISEASTSVGMIDGRGRVISLDLKFPAKIDPKTTGLTTDYLCLSNNIGIEKITPEIVRVNQESRKNRLEGESKEAAQVNARAIEQEKKSASEWYSLSRGGFAVRNAVTLEKDMTLFATLTYDKLGIHRFGLMRSDLNCRWTFDGNIINVVPLNVDGEKQINFEYSCLDKGLGFFEPNRKGRKELLSKFKKQNEVMIDGLKFSAKGFTLAHKQWSGK